MALSLNPATKVITVPKTEPFMSLVSGTLYSCDTDAFRLAVQVLLTSETYAWMPQAIDHSTSQTVFGATYARFIRVINGYSVEFDDASGTDQYSVRLDGSNNDIADVESGILVQNLVQVIPTNAAGLIEGGVVQEEIIRSIEDWGAANYAKE